MLMLFFYISFGLNIIVFLTGFARKTFIPYKETFGESFLQGRVVKVDTDARVVVLEDGQVGCLLVHVLIPNVDKHKKCTWFSEVCLTDVFNILITGSVLYTPYPVYWNRWSFSGEIQCSGLL